MKKLKKETRRKFENMKKNLNFGMYIKRLKIYIIRQNNEKIAYRNIKTPMCYMISFFKEPDFRQYT